MKLSTQKPIDAPSSVAFQCLCRFDLYEREARNRGVVVNRSDRQTPPTKGFTWDVAFRLRGKAHRFELEITELVPDHLLTVDFVSPNLKGFLRAELADISSQGCEIKVGLEVRPVTLSARLLLQSATLVKQGLEERFEARVSAFVREVEDEYRIQS